MDNGWWRNPKKEAFEIEMGEGLNQAGYII